MGHDLTIRRSTQLLQPAPHPDEEQEQVAIPSILQVHPGHRAGQQAARVRRLGGPVPGLRQRHLPRRPLPPPGRGRGTPPDVAPRHLAGKGVTLVFTIFGLKTPINSCFHTESIKTLSANYLYMKFGHLSEKIQYISFL